MGEVGGTVQAFWVWRTKIPERAANVYRGRLHRCPRYVCCPLRDFFSVLAPDRLNRPRRSVSLNEREPHIACTPAAALLFHRPHTKKILCFWGMSDTIRGKLCIYKGPLRGKRKGVMLMKKRNYFSVFLTLAVLPALLLCGCEDTAVSYSIAGESQAVSESVDGGSSAADSSSVTGDVSAAGSVFAN